MMNIVNSVNSKSNNYSINSLCQMALRNCRRFLKLVNSVLYINCFKANKKVRTCACEILEEDYSNVKIKYDNLNRLYLYNKELFDQKIEQPFISILEENGVSMDMVFTKDELLVLKLAVSHNGGIINLCNRIDTINSLMVKGLVKLDNNGFLSVDKIFSMLIKTGNANGNITFDKPSDSFLDKNIVSIFWKNFD